MIYRSCSIYSWEALAPARKNGSALPSVKTLLLLSEGVRRQATNTTREVCPNTTKSPKKMFFYEETEKKGRDPFAYDFAAIQGLSHE